MVAARVAQGWPSQTLVDFTSAHGKAATHARGTLVVNSVANLRTMGLYETYASLLTQADREGVSSALATSWVPMSLLVAHYDACDRLAISDEVVARAGQLTAERLSGMFFGRALRIARDGGLDVLPRVLTETDRLMERLYQGGRCLVVRTGPKDLVVETSGLPFSHSTYYRAVYLSYFRVAASLLCKKCIAKYVKPREPGTASLAIACSWV